MGKKYDCDIRIRRNPPWVSILVKPLWLSSDTDTAPFLPSETCSTGNPDKNMTEPVLQHLHEVRWEEGGPEDPVWNAVLTRGFIEVYPNILNYSCTEKFFWLQEASAHPRQSQKIIHQSLPFPNVKPPWIHKWLISWLLPHLFRKELMFPGKNLALPKFQLSPLPRDKAANCLRKDSQVTVQRKAYFGSISHNSLLVKS